MCLSSAAAHRLLNCLHSSASIKEDAMRTTFSIAACLLPIAMATSAQSQGPSGRSGSGAAGVEAQAKSTNPSGLAGSTGIKPDRSQDEPGNTSSSTDKASTRTESTPTDGSRGVQAPNRSASGNSTHPSSDSQPATSGDAAKPSKSRANAPR